MGRPRDQLPAAPAPIRLAALRCRRCDAPGCTIICLGRDALGDVSLAWCGERCARADGWPGLASEAPRRVGKQARASRPPVPVCLRITMHHDP